ncbi:MAG: DNA-processing protein DprA [Acidobacteria bacterium]|nr:DNA-processing protein DprA [Acidobacteriota bacterium]MBI3657687.1 DNA-processing protein DprA [Acidobacteriota bacterium]
MDIIRIQECALSYPSTLRKYLGDDAPKSIMALGNIEILQKNKIALFCSVKCPGKLIIQSYDLAKQWGEAGTTVIGGFHSPMERECLNILLRGKQPDIVCPARSIVGMRLRVEYKQPLADGRLLLLSSFEAKQRRITVENAIIRNRFVAALADAVFVAYAEPGGKTEQFCREIVSWGKPLYTFVDSANANLLKLGAKPVHSYNQDPFSEQSRSSTAP